MGTRYSPPDGHQVVDCKGATGRYVYILLPGKKRMPVNIREVRVCLSDLSSGPLLFFKPHSHAADGFRIAPPRRGP
jgi:hypothetical protein